MVRQFSTCVAKRFVPVSLLASLTLLSACSAVGPYKVKDPQLVASPDKVSMMLAQAADKASNALETLAAVEQKRTPAASIAPISGAPTELRRAVTVNWIGPAADITQMLAERAGYRFEQLGAAPATPVTVNLDVTNKPVIEALRSVGLQLGSRGDIHVDSQRRVVELQYGSVLGAGNIAMPRRRGM